MQIPDWLDNPILVKHIRSRLRPPALGAGAGAVALLCLVILATSLPQGFYRKGNTFALYLMLQTILLVIMGSVQVGSAMSQAKSSGILDFHRVTPLSPGRLVIGFFLGAPIREYVLYAVTLPFVFYCIALGEPTFLGFINLTVALFLAAWLLQGVALLNGLLVPAGKSTRAFVGGASVLFLFIGAPVFFAVFQSGRLADIPFRLGFFGLSLPWIAVAVFVSLPLLFILYLASVRKMASDSNHPLSKIQGLLALATVGLLLVGVVWKGDFGQPNANPPHPDDRRTMTVVVLYLLALAGLMLPTMVTANRAEYFKGLWRAQKLGLKTLSAWDDLALNRWFVAAVSLMVLGLCTWSTYVLDPAGNRTIDRNMGLAIAVAVITVAATALALQFFLLQFGRMGATFFALFLFVTWLLPILAGILLSLGVTWGSGAYYHFIAFNLSPVVGVGTLANGGIAGIPAARTAIEAAALVPPLLYLFVFNSLLTMAQRQAMRDFLLSSQGARQARPAHPLEPGADPRALELT